MDDREFELYLSERLHRRLDGLRPSTELRAGVDQVLSTRPEPIGLALLRSRRRELGWGALVAAGLIVAFALANGGLGGPFGPGTPSVLPQATGISGMDRHFIVLPPAGYEPDKSDGTLAADVLSARLRALLFVGDSPNAFTTAVGNAITFIVPAGGPSDDSIRTVLRAPGEVAVVPLPESYANGTNTAVVGQNLPTDEPALFGWDGIADATTSIDQEGRPVLLITLRAAAADAFGTFTTTHIGGTFAIVIDDDVALLPTINEPITDGKIEVSAGGLPGSLEASDFAESAGIIAGGRLPDPWIMSTVPELMSPSDIETILELEFGKVEPPLSTSVDLRITAADLDASLVGRRWTAVWRLGLDGLAGGCPTPLPSDERGICRWTDPNVTHIFEAETGEWLGTAEMSTK